MSESHQREEAIFDAAMELPPGQRAAHLDHACGGDAALRQRIESLLKACETRCEFLDSPADPAAAKTMNVLPASFEKAGDKIGRYKLLQQIGEGGCGVVYMAEQEEPVQRRVALKVIKLGLDTKSVIARFEAERQALALMDHPNIAKVLDAGATETGRPYFVMELVRGLKITEYCDEARLSTNARLDLFIQVCQAIQHAHQKGIIHRDIKPSNILVTINDGAPVPKVIDFGIAKATGGLKLTNKTVFTAFEQFIGTPAYMSPEQAVLTSLDIDTRSDIYALGVLLYEMLTGRTPFDAKELLAIGLDEMRRTIREQEPPRPSTRLSTLAQNELSTTAQRRGIEAPKLVSELRGDLDWIVMKALEKDRARRYETANGLASDIKRHLNNEPVVACPPSRAYRLQKMVRRNKLAFAAAGAVATALLVGVIVSAWQAQRAKAERDSAEAVLKFFRDHILAAGRPEGWEGGLGKDVTLRKAIDAAEPQIARTFQDRPLVEAAIRYSLGQSYMFLGEPALAIQQKERALVLRRQHLGLEHPDTLDSMGALGNEYALAGKFEQALPLLEDSLKLVRRMLGPKHPATLQSMQELGSAYRNAGKLDQGLALLQETLKLCKAELGPDHEHTLSVMNELVLAYNMAGLSEQAAVLGEEALLLSIAKRGPEHPESVTLMSNLSGAYYACGKVDKAVALLEQTMKVRKAKLGSDHFLTLFSTHNLAVAFRETGQTDRAVPLFEEAFNGRKAKLGGVHPNTLDTMRGLGLAYRDTGRIDQALALFEELLKLITVTLGPNHPETVLAAFSADWANRKAGKRDQLEAMYRKQRADGSGDALTFTFLLGRVLLEGAKANSADPGRSQNLAREGEQLVREYLAGVRRDYTNDHLQLAAKLGEVAELRYRQGALLWLPAAIVDGEVAELRFRQSSFDEAERLYREIVQLRRTRLKADHRDVLEATASLAGVLTDWAWFERTNMVAAEVTRLTSSDPQVSTLNSRPSPHERALEAERLLREVLAVRLGNSTNSWRIGDVKSRLGAALVSVAVADPTMDAKGRSTRLSEAELLLLDGHERFQKIFGKEQFKRDSRERMVRLYDAWNKPDKRAEWQQQLAAFDEAHPREADSF